MEMEPLRQEGAYGSFEVSADVAADDVSSSGAWGTPWTPARSPTSVAGSAFLAPPGASEEGSSCPTLDITSLSVQTCLAHFHTSIHEHDAVTPGCVVRGLGRHFAEAQEKRETMPHESHGRDASMKELINAREEAQRLRAQLFEAEEALQSRVGSCEQGFSLTARETVLALRLRAAENESSNLRYELEAAVRASYESRSENQALLSELREFRGVPCNIESHAEIPNVASGFGTNAVGYPTAACPARPVLVAPRISRPENDSAMGSMPCVGVPREQLLSEALPNCMTRSPAVPDAVFPSGLARTGLETTVHDTLTRICGVQEHVSLIHAIASSEPKHESLLKTWHHADSLRHANDCWAALRSAAGGFDNEIGCEGAQMPQTSAEALQEFSEGGVTLLPKHLHGLQRSVARALIRTRHLARRLATPSAQSP